MTTEAPGARAGHVPPPAPPVSATRRAGSRIQHALAARLVRVASKLTERLSEDDAADALSAATDLDALVVALERSPVEAEPIDPRVAAAYARGRQARSRLLQAEGGMASSEELGQLLAITRQAVDKARSAGRVFALRERGDWLYPRWQVTEGQMLSGLKSVLEELSSHGHDPWSQLIFFLETDTSREGESPLDALRAGRLEAALVAARTYGEQGAR